MTSPTIKFIILWVSVFFFRLIPWRAPNVEPLLAAMMPFSKRGGVIASVTFGVISIIAFDAITSGWGEWTWITAAAYGLLGVFSHWYFSTREATRFNFVTFGIMGTLAYDALTGLTIGPLFHHQDFLLALSGQIPFTALHLIGTTLFASILSPLIYRYLILNDALGASKLWKQGLANN